MAIVMTRTMTVMLMACLFALTSGVVSASKVVYFYNWAGADNGEEVFIDLVAEFEREHPGIEVELIRGGSVGGRGTADRLLSLIAAGTPPDVIHFERSTVIEYAAKGLLHPLDREFASIEQDFVPGAAQEVIHDGSVYGVPWGTDIRGLFWNKDHFNEAGLHPEQAPATMEELDLMAQKLTQEDGQGRWSRLGFVPWLGNWYSVGWLYTFGGNIYDTEHLKPRVNSDNHVLAMEWIQDYGQRYPYDAVTATISGRSANNFYDRILSMMPQWNGFANLVHLADPTLDFWVGEVPHPDFGTNGTWMGGYSHVISSSARNLENAFILLKWLSRKEAEIARYRSTGSLPTRWEALAEIGEELSATDAILVQQTDVAWGRPPLWHPPFLTAVNAAQVRVARLQASAREALDEAQRVLELDFDNILGN